MIQTSEPIKSKMFNLSNKKWPSSPIVVGLLLLCSILVCLIDVSVDAKESSTNRAISRTKAPEVKHNAASTSSEPGDKTKAPATTTIKPHHGHSSTQEPQSGSGTTTTGKPNAESKSSAKPTTQAGQTTKKAVGETKTTVASSSSSSTSGKPSAGGSPAGTTTTTPTTTTTTTSPKAATSTALSGKPTETTTSNKPAFLYPEIDFERVKIQGQDPTKMVVDKDLEGSLWDYYIKHLLPAVHQ